MALSVTAEHTVVATKTELFNMDLRMAQMQVFIQRKYDR